MILGVHGIGNYKYFRDNERSPERATQAISDEWSEALAQDVRVAYYAHHLFRGTPQGDDPARMQPEEQDLLIDWVEALQPAKQIPQGPKSARARQAADWITRNFGATARTFAIAFCREVHTYLQIPERRQRARWTVATAIADHKPKVIVAHSLGSVVAYETLQAFPEHQVELLVTIGSPLAMPGVVFDRLLPKPAPKGQKPRSVTTWVNAADVGDIVAIPRGGLANHFDDVRDVDVVIGEWDFHTAKSYLKCADVQALIQS